MKVKSIAHLKVELTKGVQRAAAAALTTLSAHTETTVINDYIKRVQQLHYPLRNPKTRDVIESMPPKDIVHRIKRIVLTNKATVYVEPDTDADKSARMQELYGGKPWQKIRVNMQNLDNINAILKSMGLKGIKAMPKMR